MNASCPILSDAGNVITAHALIRHYYDLCYGAPHYHCSMYLIFDPLVMIDMYMYNKLMALTKNLIMTA